MTTQAKYMGSKNTRRFLLFGHEMGYNAEGQAHAVAAVLSWLPAEPE
jgi:hypothetical protein